MRAYEATWRGAAPEAKQAGLIPPGWFDDWAKATLDTDPGAPTGTVRAPAGAVQDVREHWTVGRALYDLAAITRPVLLVRGEWDVDVRHDMAQDLFARLTSVPWKRWVEIGNGTHMLLMERNRLQAFDAVAAFLTEKAPHF